MASSDARRRTLRTRRRATLLLGIAALALAPACRGGSSPREGISPGRMTSTRDGVYTTAQADRGERVFNGVCYRCHSRSEWSHESFLRNWSGRPAEDLFNRLYETMPPRGPLPLQDYADVIAFMLALNALPSGPSELPTEAALLRAIRIEPAAAPR